MFAGRFIIYLDKPSKLATTFSFANLVDVFANLESARRDLSFGTLFVHQGLLVTALQGGPPLLGDPDLSSTLLKVFPKKIAVNADALSSLVLARRDEGAMLICRASGKSALTSARECEDRAAKGLPELPRR